jgi:hypothetical protein
MRNLAQSDPVLQDVMRQIDEVSDSVKNKSQQAMDVLATSRTVQVSSEQPSSFWTMSWQYGAPRVCDGCHCDNDHGICNMYRCWRRAGRISPSGWAT